MAFDLARATAEEEELGEGVPAPANAAACGWRAAGEVGDHPRGARDAELAPEQALGQRTQPAAGAGRDGDDVGVEVHRLEHEHQDLLVLDASVVVVVTTERVAEPENVLGAAAGAGAGAWVGERMVAN